MLKMILCFFLVSSTVNAQVIQLVKTKSKKHPKGAEVKFLASPKTHTTKSFYAHLKLPAHGKVPEHRDPTEEVIYILKGKGTLWLNDVAHSVGPGSFVLMPAQSKVKFEAGDQPVEAFQVFSPSGPEKKYESWQ